MSARNMNAQNAMMYVFNMLATQDGEIQEEELLPMIQVVKEVIPHIELEEIQEAFEETLSWYLTDVDFDDVIPEVEHIGAFFKMDEGYDAIEVVNVIVKITGADKNRTDETTERLKILYGCLGVNFAMA